MAGCADRKRPQTQVRIPCQCTPAYSCCESANTHRSSLRRNMASARSVLNAGCRMDKGQARRMTAKERIRAAIAHKKTGTCPYYLCLDEPMRRRLIEFTGDERRIHRFPDAHPGPRYSDRECSSNDRRVCAPGRIPVMTPLQRSQRSSHAMASSCAGILKEWGSS